MNRLRAYRGTPVPLIYQRVTAPVSSWAATTQRVSVAALGDSHTEGAWAGGDAASWRTNGWVAQLRTYLQTKYGDGGEGFIGLNRATRAGTWTQLTDFSPFGQAWYSNDITATNTFPVVNADNFDIFYARGGGYGTFNVEVDGGAPITITPSGSADSSTQRVNIPLGSLGSHTVVVKPLTGTLYLVAGAAYKGSFGVVVHNVGRSGSVISDNVVQIDSKLGIFQYLAPKVTFVGYVSNDFGVQTALSTYRARWNTLITKLKTYGDVVSWFPPDTTRVRTLPVTDYETVARDAANDANISWLDFHRLNGAYAANTTYMYDDTHWNQLGHNRATIQGFTPFLTLLGA